MKRVLIFFIFFCFLNSVSATTVYEIDMKGDDAYFNLTFELQSEKNVPIWEVSWVLPSNSELISIEDEKPIKEYRLNRRFLTFKTNFDSSGKTEVVKIRGIIKDVVSDGFEPLYTTILQLSAFENETTYATVHLPNLISASASFGFKKQMRNNTVQFMGEGPINIYLLHSAKGREYDHYLFFGTENIGTADNMFFIIPKVTGMDSPFEKFTVVTLNDDDYEILVDPWSDAKYKYAGLIILKKSFFEKEREIGTIIHETTHGFNAQVLRWNRAPVTWFDEGLAEYTEFLTNKLLNIPHAEIFGENITFEKGGKLYLLKTRGTPDDLRNYYQSGETFMNDWNAQDVLTQEFGYAFSELVIRDYVYRNGPDSLHEVYRKLSEVDHSTNTSEEYNSIVLSILNSDFKPCYSSSREEFDVCLREINQMEAVIPDIEDFISEDGENIEEEIQQTKEILAEKKESAGISFLDNLILGLMRIKDSFSTLFEGLF
jgi:hypothetical protein